MGIYLVAREGFLPNGDLGMDCLVARFQGYGAAH
jgi:hypothetical protein